MSLLAFPNYKLVIPFADRDRLQSIFGNIISGLGIARIVVSGRMVFGWKFIEKSLHEAVARTMVGRLATWFIESGEPTGAGLGGALEVVIEQHLANVVAQVRSAA